MRACKKIEARLKNDMGAEGKGIKEYANFLADELPESIFHYLHHIGGVRNTLMHEEGSNLTARNLEEFKMAAGELFTYFDQVIESKKREKEERQRLEIEALEKRKQRTLKEKEAQEKLKKFSSKYIVGGWLFALSLVPFVLSDAALKDSASYIMMAFVVVVCFFRRKKLFAFIGVFLPINVLFLYASPKNAEDVASMFDLSLIINLALLAFSCVAIRLVYTKWTGFDYKEKVEGVWAGILPLFSFSAMFYLFSSLLSSAEGYWVWLASFVIIISTFFCLVYLLAIGKHYYNLAFPFIVMSAELPFSESGLPTGLFIGCGILSLLVIYGDKIESDKEDEDIPVLEVSEPN